MTDEEFDVLDELYFVIRFDDLLEATEKDADELIKILKSLFSKGWIKVLKTVDDEVPDSEIDMDNSSSEYYFLATKKGLLAHNS